MSARVGRLTSLALVAILVVATGVPAAAQNAELAPLMALLERSTDLESAEGSSLELYEIPLSYTVREPADRSLGVTLTFPVTLGVYDLAATTGVADLVARVQTASVWPGVELQAAAGERWAVKPFFEVGLGTGSGGGGNAAEFAAGVRALGRYQAGAGLVTVGASARYASPRTSRDLIGDYTSLEIGVDAQTSLGVRLWKRELRGGGYAIARYFPDLEVPDSVLFDFGRTYEVGLSLAATPDFEIIGLDLPWIGLGYRFGDLFTGVRVNLSFPF